MSPDGIYYFSLFMRDEEEPSVYLRARRYGQDGDALYWDDEGMWFYSYQDRVRDLDWGGEFYVDSEA
jgi:hypothetical protein